MSRGKGIKVNGPLQNPEEVVKRPTGSELKALKRELIDHILTRPVNSDVVALQVWRQKLEAIRLPIAIAESRLGEWRASA